MALSYASGTFVANTATGNQAITGLGFQPKALRLIAVPLTADGAGNPGNICIGMTDFTNARCTVAATNDNVATTVTASEVDTANLLHLLTNATPTDDALATIVSADADGFTINWSDAPASAWKITYQAWGGSDITNVSVGTFNPASGTGSKSQTGVGFKPDVLLWAFGHASGSAIFGVGAASGAGAEYGAVAEAQTGRTATTDARLYHKGTSILYFGSTGTVTQEATLTSFDADGFTYNFATRGNTTDSMFYLAMKGGLWKVGTETTRATTTGTKQTSGIGFQPVGLSIFGTFATANAAVAQATAEFCIGSATAVNTSRAAGVTWTNAINQRSACVINPKIINAVDGTGANYIVADMSARDSDSFTLNYSTVQGAALEFGYVAFGNGPQPNGPRMLGYYTQ